MELELGPPKLAIYRFHPVQDRKLGNRENLHHEVLGPPKVSTTQGSVLDKLQVFSLPELTDWHHRNPSSIIRADWHAVLNHLIM